jgi:hypothetical protein
MDFKKLEKATKLYEQIKQLDADIIEIDKFALTVANNETESCFELRCKDLTKQKEKENKLEFDEDGSIKREGDNTLRLSLISSWMLPANITPPNDDIVIKSQLSVNNVMNMLGILLHDKQTKRQQIIEKLNKLRLTND